VGNSKKYYVIQGTKGEKQRESKGYTEPSHGGAVEGGMYSGWKGSISASRLEIRNWPLAKEPRGKHK